MHKAHAYCSYLQKIRRSSRMSHVCARGLYDSIYVLAMWDDTTTRKMGCIYNDSTKGQTETNRKCLYLQHIQPRETSRQLLARLYRSVTCCRRATLGYKPSRPSALCQFEPRHVRWAEMILTNVLSREALLMMLNDFFCSVLTYF